MTKILSLFTLMIMSSTVFAGETMPVMNVKATVVREFAKGQITEMPEGGTLAKQIGDLCQTIIAGRSGAQPGDILSLVDLDICIGEMSKSVIRFSKF